MNLHSFDHPEAACVRGDVSAKSIHSPLLLAPKVDLLILLHLHKKHITAISSSSFILEMTLSFLSS